MPANRIRAHRAAHPQRQEGVVLLIALIVLVAMTLAGLGMVRSLDTGTLVANNISFRQSAVATGDGGVEQAVGWLTAGTANLDNDDPTNGYYSTRQGAVDFTGNKSAGATDNVDWDGTNASFPVKARQLGTLSGDVSGNQVSYVIHRLCSITGSINSPVQSCATTTGTGIGSTMDSPTYDVQGLTTTRRVYYRITTRIVGPKNTASYVQAVVLL